MQYNGYYKERSASYLKVVKSSLLGLINNGALEKDENVIKALEIIQNEIDEKVKLENDNQNNYMSSLLNKYGRSK
jgi:hypothetical protein